MFDFKVFHLFWKEFKWDKDVFTKYTTDKDFGVYQVYGNHPVYGEDILLYIGKAQAQTYSTRLNGHTDFDASQVSKFTRLHLSYFCRADDLTEKNWGEAIDIVEKVLIKAHMPALNGTDVKKFLDASIPNILIFNWGDRGLLLPEVSTLRYSEFYQNTDKYNFENLALKDSSNPGGVS